MSRQSSYERIAMDNAECLEVIREEQCSLAPSSFKMDPVSEEVPLNVPLKEPCTDCTCKENLNKMKGEMNTVDLERLIDQKEKELRAEFQRHLEAEMNYLKDRFDFILQNEQIRSSYMLREAHRERQEKIKALQTQLECKNLAGLMFVICSERRKSKLEKMRLIEEYTNYILALQDILTEGQSLILNLSRGYKTAASVDQEWREKMTNIIKEFQCYIHHYGGGTPESNQYLFDMPQLLETKTPVVDNPNEDLCNDVEESNEDKRSDELNENKSWWERLDGDCRPFVMFGDMAEFQPPQRRSVLKSVKAAKSAPKKWKEYVFNNLYVKANCSNVDVIKDEYLNRLPVANKWECQAVQTQERISKTSLVTSRRMTSVDFRGNMGSILKIITSNVAEPVTKATLLGARDSMEIASATKLRERHHVDHNKVVLNVAQRRASIYDSWDIGVSQDLDTLESRLDPKKTNTNVEEEEQDASARSALGSIHNDSLQVIPGHVPDHDHKIHYEKVCPMEKCQRMRADSFIRSLPSYMRDNPFTYFEQTYEDYEVCTPEQLEVLKKRIAEKKKKEKDSTIVENNPLHDWTPSVEGVAIQTSDISVSLPPCTCRVPSPTPVSSTAGIFRVQDLLPVKQELDRIRNDCFYDSRIEFNRFQLIGEDSNTITNQDKDDFNKTRIQEIRKILKKHPSLCDIFQANARC